MRAFGADLEIVHSDRGIDKELWVEMLELAAAIAKEEGAYFTDQLNNRDTLNGYLMIGQEILNQMDGQIHGACQYVGVGGAFIGMTRPLKAAWPDLIRTVVEPAESAVIAGGEPGSHLIEGGGIGWIPEMITADTYDRTDAVSSAEAFETARSVARMEGVWTGPSGGASILAATRLARELGPGHRVVTVQPDSGLKYLSGGLYRDE